MEVGGAECVPERKMDQTAYNKLEETRTSMEEIVVKMLFIKKEGRPKSELRELVTYISLLFINLPQRKELCKRREKLEHRKSLQDTIASRKKFLSLPSHLKSLKKASLPVQQQLGILHTKKLKQHHSAELLPPHIYVIYSQLLAQKEAFGENIDMEIVGSMKDAQAFAHQQSIKDTGNSVEQRCAGTIIDNSRLDDDAPDEEDDGQRRRKRPKKVSGRESLDHAENFQSHPLRVILHIYDNEASDAKPVKLISLRFEYLEKFNVVCVGIEGSHEEPESDILCNLFPDDTGVELPHQTAKFFAGDAISFDEKKTSCPYKGAKHLAGIDFLPEVSPLLAGSGPPSSETLKGASVLSGLSLYRQQNRVQTVVQRIRSQKKAQLALMEQLDSLTKLKWPPLTYENVPWASHTPLCTLRSWLPVGPTTIQASFAVDIEQVPDSLDLDTDGRFGTLREEVECEGRWRTSISDPGPSHLNNSKPSPSKGSDLDHSKCLDLISKSMMPSGIGKSQSFKKHENNSELILESGSDLDELMHRESETESAPSIGCSEMVDRSWEDPGGREFCTILSRRARNDRNAKLEAKIKISMEYPIRPPFFTLSLSTTTSGENSSDAAAQGDSVSREKDGLEWYNELRAMEAEVNLHIIKMLHRGNENHILAHQIYCLAMLFDFRMDQKSTFSDTRKSTSVIDVGLCEPVSGRILARSFRGRDRRKMISWKDMECNLGYSY